MQNTERPSRWQRNKMWRSPSFLQIYQKYIYMWNNSYRTPTESWQKTSDFQKGKKFPTYLGRAKEKKRQKSRDGTCAHPWEGPGRELWRRKSFHTLGSPLAGGDSRGGVLEPQRRVQQQGYRGQSGEIPTQRIGADQHSPAWEACLLTCLGGWGLGAEVRALEVRSQGEGWGWLREHSQKVASAPQLARREYQKKSGPVGEARDHCLGCTRRGASCSMCPQTTEHCLSKLQRRAWAIVIISDPEACTDCWPHCHQGSCVQAQVTTHTLPGACAARHCQGSMMQGQLPWENTHHASGCCNVMLASAAGMPRTFQLWLLYPSLSPAWESKRALISRSFNSLLSGQGTEAWGWSTRRGRAKIKAEPQEMCEQRREREISPYSFRSSGLNPCNHLGKPYMCGIPE